MAANSRIGRVLDESGGATNCDSRPGQEVATRASLRATALIAASLTGHRFPPTARSSGASTGVWQPRRSRLIWRDESISRRLARHSFWNTGIAPNDLTRAMTALVQNFLTIGLPLNTRSANGAKSSMLGRHTSSINV